MKRIIVVAAVLSFVFISQTGNVRGNLVVSSTTGAIEPSDQKANTAKMDFVLRSLVEKAST